jgi:hypothetical protein
MSERQITGPPVPEVRVSLICGILAWAMGGLVFLVGNSIPSSRTAGGYGFVFLLLGVPSVLLWIIGLISGLVALRRILRSSEPLPGYGTACVGVFLCAVPMIVAVGFLLKLV